MIANCFKNRTSRLLVVLSAAWLVGSGADPARLLAEDTDVEVPKAEKKESPAKRLSRETKDGVKIIVTFYPGNADEDTVPLILLHDLKGDRSDLDELAEYLHSMGHAVIVPDLRGHGESTRQRASQQRGVGAQTRSISLRTGDDYLRIIKFDMETVKQLLMIQHNDKKLNIRKLGVVGFGMGASVSIAWGAQDWSWGDFLGKKVQGQDVKSLVLVSPSMNLRGIKVSDALKHPAISNVISVQLIVGSKKSSNRRDADSMYKFLTRNRPKQEEKPLADRQVFLEQMDTSLQGIKLLNVKDMLIDKRIAKFVQLRLTNADIPWEWRKTKESPTPPQ
jgi:alpha-beta hydrolase superfamily lysophospholipase